MNTSAHARMKLPDEQEVQLAARGQRALASCLSGKRKTRRVQLFDEADRAHEMELSISTLRLVEEILNGLAKGDAIRVVSVNAELTTQEAADLLNVSRPHLVKLLEERGTGLSSNRQAPTCSSGRFAAVQGREGASQCAGHG
ncbi:hypothetical protein [Rhodanobacter lindaniclasticus]